MPNVIVSEQWLVGGVPTDVDYSAPNYLCTLDNGAGKGIWDETLNSSAVAAGTYMPRQSVGTYQYTYAGGVAGHQYTAYRKVVYLGATYYFPQSIYVPSATSDLRVTYFDLECTIARYGWGIRPSSGVLTLTADQQADITGCIQDALLHTYKPKPLRPGGKSHEWSFMRPNYTFNTVAGTSTYALPSNFGGFDGPLTYPAGTTFYYPPIRIVKEVDIRIAQQRIPLNMRPTMAAVIVTPFDQNVGSAYQIELYPTPDAAYALTGTMKAIPVMPTLSFTSATDWQYPMGAETVSDVITEACLHSAELLFNDAPGAHSAHFDELLKAAIAVDADAMSPDTLGYNYDHGDRHQASMMDRYMTGAVQTFSNPGGAPIYNP